MKLYISASIRGADGEGASEHLQRHNILLACQYAEALRKRYTEITWVCPHENEFLNDLVFSGLIDEDLLVEAECHVIHHNQTYDGVVHVGKWVPDSGCGKEIMAAHDAHKFYCFIDDTGERSREHFEVMLQNWEKDD